MNDLAADLTYKVNALRRAERAEALSDAAAAILKVATEMVKEDHPDSTAVTSFVTECVAVLNGMAAEELSIAKAMHKR